LGVTLHLILFMLGNWVLGVGYWVCLNMHVQFKDV
jgi:hypothetical protein